MTDKEPLIDLITGKPIEPWAEEAMKRLAAKAGDVGEEPTAKGDRVAGLMREHFEAHKHEKWDGFTADNLMIRLLNIVLREYRLVEPSQPVVAEAWRTVDKAPHACHVLAAYFDTLIAEWICEFVPSPPSDPWTHFMFVGTPDAHPQASPPPVQSEVTRDDAIKFLENACRNWPRVPPLSNDDFDDVAGALSWFLKKRLAALSETLPSKEGV